MNIYPSILTDELAVAHKQLSLSDTSGLIQTVQIDVIDGYFADNITLTPSSLLEMNFGELELDFHLMTQEPLDFVREIIDLKDELPVRAVLAQVEQMTNQQDYIDEVKRYNWQVGMSLNIHTPLSAIDFQSYEQLDVMQLMSIQAGFQGQKLHEYIFTKLQELHTLMEMEDLHFEVIVDGGIDDTNISKLFSGGATSFSIGSYLWQAEDFSTAVEILESSI